LAKPYVQNIRLDIGGPIKVDWYRDVSDSLSIGEPEEPPDITLARIELDEFSSGKSAREAIFDAVFHLNQRGLHATHLLVGSTEFVRDWFGIPSVTHLPLFEGTDYFNFLGLMLCEVESLEQDVVVLLSAEVRDASLTEVTRGLKISP